MYFCYRFKQKIKNMVLLKTQSGLYFYHKVINMSIHHFQMQLQA